MCKKLLYFLAISTFLIAVIMVTNVEIAATNSATDSEEIVAAASTETGQVMLMTVDGKEIEKVTALASTILRAEEHSVTVEDLRALAATLAHTRFEPALALKTTESGANFSQEAETRHGSEATAQALKFV